MIVCAKCGGRSGVLASIRVDDTLRRRRSCKSCGHRWHTVEVKTAAPVNPGFAKSARAAALKPEVRAKRGAAFAANADARLARKRNIPITMVDEYRRMLLSHYGTAEEVAEIIRRSSSGMLDDKSGQRL